MEKNKEQTQEYACEVCGAASDKPKNCCGQSMKISKTSSFKNSIRDFNLEEGKQGNKKKNKDKNVSRFSNEENSSTGQQNDLS